jgi:hypothetical protein
VGGGSESSESSYLANLFRCLTVVSYGHNHREAFNHSSSNLFLEFHSQIIIFFSNATSQHTNTPAVSWPRGRVLDRYDDVEDVKKKVP